MSKQLTPRSKPSLQKYDTVDLFIPFFTNDEPPILSKKRQDKAIKNELSHQMANPHAKAKFGKNHRPAIVLGQAKNPYNPNDQNDYIVLAEFRSSDKVKPSDPERVLLQDWGPNDANVHHRSYATIGEENLIFMSKTIVDRLTIRGHLSEKDIQIYSDATFNYERSKHEPKIEEPKTSISDEELMQKLDKSLASINSNQTSIEPEF